MTTAKSFGDWTVLEMLSGRKWKCRCKCGHEAEVDRSNLLAGRSTSCNQGACRTASRQQTAENFWSRVKQDEGPCWPWQGAVGKRGYGVVSWDGYLYLAHRVAAWLGGVIDDPHEPKGVSGILVSHECDNKLCCRPLHLKRSTNSQNQKEVWERVRRKDRA